MTPPPEDARPTHRPGKLTVKQQRAADREAKLAAFRQAQARQKRNRLIGIITGSIADVTFIAKRNTSVEEVNKILSDAAKDPRWAGIFTVTNEPLVSSDIKGQLYGAIVDLEMTRVVDGNLVKVLSWYDNEMGYTNTLVMHVIEVAKFI